MPPIEPRSPDPWSPNAPADALTMYVWRPASEWLRAKGAEAGIHESGLLLAAALAGLLGFLLFWRGHFGLGLIAAVAFLVASSASRRAQFAAWGIFVVPLFWWWAWSHGLGASDRTLAPVYGLMVLWAAVGGGAADLAIALVFRRRFTSLAIEEWQRFDSNFALVAAGPSTNLVLLALGLLFGRPGAGLVAVGWWSIATAIVHAVRLAQAGELKARGESLEPWRGE